MQSKLFVRGALAISLLSVLSLGAVAQLPAGTQFVGSNVGGLISVNGLFGMAGNGTVTTMIFTGSSSPPNAVAMSPDNDDVLVFDAGGVHAYDIVTGTINFTRLSTGGGNLHFGMVDEDGGILWVIGAGATRGRVYQAARPNGANTTLLTTFANANFDGIARIGSTGKYAVLDGTAATQGILILERDGSVSKRIRAPSNLSGIDWNVWEDRLYVTRRGNGGNQGLFRVDVATGTVTTVGPSGPFADFLQGVETIEQPTNRLIVNEAGPDPQHVFVFDPVGNSVVTIHQGKGRINFADVDIVRARQFWALQVVEVGSRTPLSVDFGPNHASQQYQVALSFGFSPGIPVAGAGTIHLVVDPLFLTSLLAGPPTFENFAGVLDAQGAATKTVAFTVPTIPQLQGIRIYGSAVTYGPGGIQAISNSWGITILGPPE